MKETKKKYLLQFIEQYHNDCAGITNIIDKLVEFGEVLTTDTAVNILDGGFLSNFIKCFDYSEGIGIVKWEFNQLFWESNLWREFLRVKMKNLIDERDSIQNEIDELSELNNNIPKD
jgi:hypothetical protein